MIFIHTGNEVTQHNAYQRYVDWVQKVLGTINMPNCKSFLCRCTKLSPWCSSLEMTKKMEPGACEFTTMIYWHARPIWPYSHETPHSPDIASCDSFCFSQIINIFKGKWFQDTEMTMLNAMQQLSEIPKRQYERCWNKCTQAEGRSYFEGGLIHYQSKFSIVSLIGSVWILFD